MRRIDNRTVELNPSESKAHDRFEALLDEGWSCTMAAAQIKQEFPGLAFSFYNWLID